MMRTKIVLATVLSVTGGVTTPVQSRQQVQNSVTLQVSGADSAKKSSLDTKDSVLTAEPEIAAFCITQDLTANASDFTAAIEKYCHRQSSKGVRIATGDHYTKSLDCNADRCITLSLFFKCLDHNNASTYGIMPRHACNEYFQLPWSSGETCVSGGYVGSSVPGACWTALSCGYHIVGLADEESELTDPITVATPPQDSD